MYNSLITYKSVLCPWSFNDYACILIIFQRCGHFCCLHILYLGFRVSAVLLEMDTRPVAANHQRPVGNCTSG